MFIIPSAKMELYFACRELKYLLVGCIFSYDVSYPESFNETCSWESGLAVLLNQLVIRVTDVLPDLVTLQCFNAVVLQ